MNDKIVEVAKKLFAEKGYQSVSTREIADFLGINISTFHYHTGGKSNLYKSVIESVYQRELALFHKPISNFSDKDYQNKEKVRTALYEALFGFFEQMAHDPDRSALYVRRWLEWPDEFMEQEVKNTLETFLPFFHFMDSAQKAGSIKSTDTSIFLRSFLWMIYGYFITGIIDWKKWVSDPMKKKNMMQFRKFLEEFIDSMLFQGVESRLE
jgi:AcrR family transcriptional regulator